MVRFVVDEEVLGLCCQFVVCLCYYYGVEIFVQDQCWNDGDE